MARLFTLISALSLLLSLITAALWWRSLRVSDSVWWQSDDDAGHDVRKFSLVSGCGGVQVEYYRLLPLRDKPFFQFDPVSLAERRGFHLSCSSARTTLPSWTPGLTDELEFVTAYPYEWPDMARFVKASPRLEMRWESFADSSYANTWRGVVVPYWLLCLVTLLAPGARFGWHARRALAVRGRSRRPLCVECGYNLTANISGVCPECGRPVPSGVNE